MKTRKQLLVLGHVLKVAAACLLALASSTRAATVWTGPTISYTQPGFDPTVPANQDRLTPNVWLTRAATEGLFNAAKETAYDKITRTRPSDTEWAYGELADYDTLNYTTWAAMSANNPPSMVGKQAVVHLISEDIYVAIRFTSWGSSGIGGFGYTRSTPGTAVPSPTVSITNPVSGGIFAAPINVQLQATATASSGPVTNVEFFANAASLGSVPSAPFNLMTGNLAAGDYSFSAVATAVGISGTSSPVNISVVSPVAISATAPQIENGQFSFVFTANPGLNYVVERSSNLTHWVSVITQVANSNLVPFSEGLSEDSFRAYRVGRLPNP